MQNWEFALKKMKLRRIAPLSKLRISHFPRAIPCDNLVKINIEGFSQAFIAGRCSIGIRIFKPYNEIKAFKDSDVENLVKKMTVNMSKGGKRFKMLNRVYSYRQ